MSSEISIDAGRLNREGRLKPAPTSQTPPDPVGAGFSRPNAKPDDGFRPWHFFVLSSILLATVAVMLSRQSSPEGLILISLTIAAAGSAAAAQVLAALHAAVEEVGAREAAALGIRVARLADHRAVTEDAALATIAAEVAAVIVVAADLAFAATHRSRSAAHRSADR